MKSFMDQLKRALKEELDLLLEEQVYIDEERLKPGYRYNEALGRAICESVCMIVVYSPRYARSEYCRREYEAMAQLEEKRRAVLGPAAGSAGFIIPIILRGEDDVPPRIAETHQHRDFSKFSLVSAKLAEHPEYLAEIREIARVIYDHYMTFDTHGVDPCATCTAFQLPSAADVAPWRPTFVNR